MLNFLSYTAQALLLGDGAAHGGLGHPTGISNGENAPQTYPQASLMEATLQLRFLLPMCVKLTTKVGMAISNSISVTIETKKGREVGGGGEGKRDRTSKGLKT